MPLVIDIQKITGSVWALFQDSSGKVLDEYSVRKWTFHEGICPEVRGQVWKFLLAYYPFLSTREEREQIDTNKRLEYQRLVDTWQCGVIPDGLADYIRVIGKDCVRTDRRHASFKGSGLEATENIGILNRVLTTFCVYNSELGYVQGMNEFLSPLLLMLGCEHQAFWCLAEVMRRMTHVFSDLTLSQPLSSVARLCYYADTQLHDHIEGIHGDDDWMFCYRGVLLNFKREFSMEDVFTLWEIIWCDHLTKHFQLFVAVAILVHYKQELLLCKTVESLMQFAMSLSCNAPLGSILTIARALAEQLKGEEYCPYELRYLVSDEGCAPPPLVGFVRARQRISTLYSNKISRSTIWRSLFGDHPITSPFMLSPSHTTTPTNNAALNLSSPFPNSAQNRTEYNNSLTSNSGTLDTQNTRGTRNTADSTTPIQLVSNSESNVGPPPKLGFVPRNMFPKNSLNAYDRSLDVSVRYQAIEGDTSSQQACESQTMPHTSPLHNYYPSSSMTPNNYGTTHGTLSPQAPFTTATKSTGLENHTHLLGSAPALLEASPVLYNSASTFNAGVLTHSTINDGRNTIELAEAHNHKDNCSTPLYAYNGSLEASKDRRKTGSNSDVIHYDNRSETVSGGVFDEGAWQGSEFDQLRSEPSLLF